MAHFTRDDRGGGDRGGFRPSGGGRGFDNRSSRPMMMHQAVCSNCGKSCEVPFRPTGDKPVYCRECFSAKGGAPSGDRFQKKDRRDFAPSAPSRASSQSGSGNDEIKKQLESVNAKLERLISAVQALASAKGPAKAVVPEKVVAKKTAKKAKKS